MIFDTFDTYDHTGLLLNNNYFVEFTFGADSLVTSFSKISAITQKEEVETIVEGSGQIHLVPKHLSSPNTLVFEKGIFIMEKMDCLLHAGQCIDIGQINVMKNNNIERCYTFFNGVVTECEIGELDALSSQVLIQKFKVSYTHLRCDAI